jgi:hypothetical protein
MNHARNAQKQENIPVALKHKSTVTSKLYLISRSYKKYVTFIVKFIHNNKCYGGVKCYLKCILLFRKFAT